MLRAILSTLSIGGRRRRLRLEMVRLIGRESAIVDEEYNSFTLRQQKGQHIQILDIRRMRKVHMRKICVSDYTTISE